MRRSSSNLPDALPDGSYLLTVIRGEGQKDRDVFDMAVQGQTTVSGTPGPRAMLVRSGLRSEGRTGPVVRQARRETPVPREWPGPKVMRARWTRRSEGRRRRGRRDGPEG